MLWLSNYHVCYKFQDPISNSIHIFVLRQVHSASKGRAYRKLSLSFVSCRMPGIRPSLSASAVGRNKNTEELWLEGGTSGVLRVHFAPRCLVCGDRCPAGGEAPLSRALLGDCYSPCPPRPAPPSSLRTGQLRSALGSVLYQEKITGDFQQVRLQGPLFKCHCL